MEKLKGVGYQWCDSSQCCLFFFLCNVVVILHFLFQVLGERGSGWVLQRHQKSQDKANTTDKPTLGLPMGPRATQRLRDWERISGLRTSNSCCQQHIKSLSTHYYSIRYEVLYIFASSPHSQNVVVFFHETSFQHFLALPDEMQRCSCIHTYVHVCIYKHMCSIYDFTWC